jgi:hypothetical protein
MNANERIQAVERFGFTTRQAGFLVAVMTHSGVCLPRQYAAFAGVAYGHKVNRFFERLVGRGLASACPSSAYRAGSLGRATARRIGCSQMPCR